MGCLSVAEAEDQLEVNKDELDDAQWFSKEEVKEALNRCATEAGMARYLRLRTGVDHERQYAASDPSVTGLLVPPPTAIAHHLIRAWVEQD